jgi:hypothetical protein
MILNFSHTYGHFLRASWTGPLAKVLEQQHIFHQMWKIKAKNVFSDKYTVWSGITFPQRLALGVLFRHQLLTSNVCSLILTSIRLVTIYYRAIAAHLMSVVQNKLILWRRTRNVLTHSLSLARLMEIFYHFSKFGLGLQKDLCHQKVHLSCKLL